ncbi:MAG: RluA family pseudouridine synthase [Proteobacteria bacterium]|nr:RluA family pseudouridine synthase [Pseudomonadota bacterium]
MEDVGEEPQRFVVGDLAGPLRIDVFLTHQLAGSRGRLQRQIALGNVQVNGQVVRASHKLRVGDLVEVAPADVEVDASTGPVVPQAMPLDVLFEDAAVIVIAKPAGMVVHPAGAITHGTLANALAHRWGSEPYLVHRLDRDTSGVMVVARTPAARAGLVAQFAGRTTTKHYVALVHGRVADPHGRIEVALRRDRKHRLKMVTCAADEGREAVTRYAVRTRWHDLTLLDVVIETGRTHQIRVHCAHLGHPVVADEMYGKGRTIQVRDPDHRQAIEAVGRQFLHAARLSFDHPSTGERLTFEAPLGDELVGLLAALG